MVVGQIFAAILLAGCLVGEQTATGVAKSTQHQYEHAPLIVVCTADNYRYDVVNEAVRRWSTVLAPKLVPRVSRAGTSYCENTPGYNDVYLTFGPLQGTTDGWTVTRFDDKGARIKLNDSITGDALLSAAMHEIGHLFRLRHTDNRADVMYADRNYVIEFSPGDIAQITALHLTPDTFGKGAGHGHNRKRHR